TRRCNSRRHGCSAGWPGLFAGRKSVSLLSRSKESPDSDVRCMTTRLLRDRPVPAERGWRLMLDRIKPRRAWPVRVAVRAALALALGGAIFGAAVLGAAPGLA